jgi:acetoin utilization protein AcuB
MGIMDEPLGNHRLTLFSPFVLANQHIYEVIEIASRLKLTVIPVLDENKNYLGIIGLSDLFPILPILQQHMNQGAVIILEMEPS